MTSNQVLGSPIRDFFLADGGEMGQRIREFDWSKTAVGPMDTWPASLVNYVSLLLNSKFPIFIWWGEELVQFYNDAYRPSLGNSGKHPMALGQRGEDCWPEIWPVIKPMIDQVLAGRGATWSEDQLIPIYRNGRLEDVYWTFGYSPIKVEEEKIGGVLVVCNETTSQVISRKTVERAEERARLAIESAELGTYEINLVTNAISTSVQFRQIWGITRITHTLTREEYERLIHPEDMPIREEALRMALITGNLHYEVRLVLEDSSFRWVRVRGKVIYDPEKKPVSLIGIVQNINAHKLFAAQLNKEVEERTLELQRSNDDLLQFAHVTSHDLKEPLRKIRLYSDRLLDELGDVLRGKGVQYVGKIAHATTRMYSMIEGVLKYSSLSSSEQTISLIDLNEVIASILQDQEVLIAEKKASIVFEDLPTIEGASVLIYQLFYNLVNNALKFCRTDITPVVTLVANVEKVWGRPFAKIVVTDNGIGFNQANAEKMFDMFARLNSRDMFEGTGLGLSLCKKIVERHDGTITATGNKDEGASFTVLLPLQQFKETL